MKIRKASFDDAKAICDIYTKYVENTNITFEYETPSVEMMKQRIGSTLEKYPYLVAEINQKVVGYAYASSFHDRKAYEWACELSVYVDGNYHHQGIAKALYNVLMNILKEMHIQVVYANITHPNEKSERFHLAYGFQQVGLFEKCGYKFGKWHDIVWMQKRIGNDQDVQDVIYFSKLQTQYL